MTADEPKWEPWMERALQASKEKFIRERVNGFTHPENNQWYGPVSREEAEARWQRAEPKFRQLVASSPEMREKFYDPAESWKSGEPAASAATEPSQNVSLNQMLSGMQELTHDDLLDMWEKAKTLPEPQRQKAIRYITHLSKRLESRPAVFLVNILLETQF